MSQKFGMNPVRGSNRTVPFLPPLSSDGKLVQQLRAALPLHGVLSVEELAGVLTQRTSLTRHQVFTLHRHLARRGPVTTAALLEALLLPPS